MIVIADFALSMAPSGNDHDTLLTLYGVAACLEQM